MKHHHRSFVMRRKKNLQQLLPVLELPTEIRLRIWYFAVVENKKVEIKAPKPIYFKNSMIDLPTGQDVRGPMEEPGDYFLEHKTGMMKPRVRHYSPFAIASVCRQLYYEVAPIYYGRNTFRVLYAPRHPMGPDIQHFLVVLKPENRLCITSLSLYIPFPNCVHWHDFQCRVFSRLPRLKKLEFNMPSLDCEYLKDKLRRLCGEKLKPSFAVGIYEDRYPPVFAPFPTEDLKNLFRRISPQYLES